MRCASTSSADAPGSKADPSSALRSCQSSPHLSCLSMHCRLEPRPALLSDQRRSCPIFLGRSGSTDDGVEFCVFLVFNLEQIGCVLGLLESFIVLILELDEALHLILDFFMFFSESALQTVDPVFFEVQIIVDSCVLQFISLQLLLQQPILLR